MSTTLGKTKGTDVSGDFRQFIINCLGENDQRKYFSISPFGTDFNVPLETKGLTADSKNKDDKFVLGFLNQLKVDDLNPGDKVIFSTLEDGSAISSYIRLNNDGTMHQNGDVDFLAGFTKLKSGFDELLSDHNDLVNAFNAHMHATAATGPPSIPTPGSGIPATPSTASIDDSKKDNLKTE